MKKAVLSNRIYMTVDAELRNEINEKLTYTIPTYNPNDPPLLIKNMARIRDDLISMPVGCMKYIPEDYEIVDKRVSNEIIFPEFKGELRGGQIPIYNSVDDNCMINAAPGFGKTYTALAIAAKLKQKTLIITHTTNLRNQWAAEIRHMMGIEPAIIGSGEVNIDSSIVVGNVQTLYRNIDLIRKEFGLVVMDECLDYNSRVTTREGPKTIGTIVNSETFCDVLSWDEKTKNMEYKPILKHFKHKQDEDMIKFVFENKSVLKCTMNHNVYSYNKGKIAAEYLMEDDYVICQHSHKSSHLLTKEVKPLVLGMILGDGSLRQNGKSVRLGITHGEAQLEYLEYKKALLIGATKQDNVKGCSGYKPENSIYSFSTLSFYDLDNWRDQLYGDKTHKSIITKDIAKQLTRESWSIMYQDDGSISDGKYITFSFCELDEVSIGNLQDSLYTLFDIDSVYYTCKKGYSYLRLNLKSAKIFIESIADLIHPCLSYKKGVFAESIDFVGIEPIEAFELFTVQKVESVLFEKAKYGYRYNIEVADNHNYFAGNKLVGNCHHVSAATFTKLVDSNHARYKIGLSATLQRKDGKHVVFRDYFGDTVYKPPAENTMTPTVDVIRTNIRFQDGAKTPWANRVTNLTNKPEYRELVAILASTYAAKGHKVLVVGGRTALLKNCADMIGDNAVCVVGEVSQDDRNMLQDQILKGEKNILLGTQAIYSEGISINSLSCLILANPINNDPLLEQLVGRINREFPDKLKPIVVDLHLIGNTARRQASARMGFYMREGYNIREVAM